MDHLTRDAWSLNDSSVPKGRGQKRLPGAKRLV